MSRAIRVGLMGDFVHNYGAEIARQLPDGVACGWITRDDAAWDAVIASSWDAGFRGQPALVQIAGAGFDHFDLASLPSGATVCNCRGHEEAVAEFVVAGLLARSRRLMCYHTTFSGLDWSLAPARGGPLAPGLAGAVLGILGLGGIGRKVAEFAGAIGMQPIGCNRTVADDASIPVYPLHQLDAFLDRIDHLAVALPLTPETRGLIGTAELARVPPHAIVVNVGRAEVIDEAALYEALRANRLAGAVLDVWYRYPTAEACAAWPARLPFHELPNITATPHVAAWTKSMMRQRVEQMIANVSALQTGVPFINIIRPPLEGRPNSRG